jgi:hypothetical protein
LLLFQVKREDVFWRIGLKRNIKSQSNEAVDHEYKYNPKHISPLQPNSQAETDKSSAEFVSVCRSSTPAPSCQKIPLYNVAHSRAGDKGNDINFSLIPYFPPDIKRLKPIITSQWIKSVVSPLLDLSPSSDLVARDQRDNWVNENVKVEIYEVKGIQSLNIVVRNILDGGVNCSRRIDRHGKTISDLILCQQVVLPS